MMSSKYNYITKLDDQIIMYNSASGIITAFPETCKNELYSILNGEKNNGTMYSYCIQSNYVVDNEETELRRILAKVKACLEKEELFLMLLPTLACNFQCEYCYESGQHTYMTPLIQDKIVTYVESVINKYKAVHVEWYGGEPLLCMDIIERVSQRLISICKAHQKMYYSMITTNGYFLTADNVTRLLKCKVIGYQITVDGLEKTHDKVRYAKGHGKTWSVIINNLRYIRDSIRTSTIRVMIRTNLTYDIYRERNELFSFLKKEFGADRRFSIFVHLAQDWGRLKDPSIKDRFCGVQEFYDTLESVARVKLSTKLYYNFLQPAARICYAAKKNFFMIMPDGKIGTCSCMLNENDNFYTCTDEWQTSNYHWDGISRLDKECLKCKKMPLCFGLVCPKHKGFITDTCGYELSDVEKLLRIIVQTDDRVKYWRRNI